MILVIGTSTVLALDTCRGISLCINISMSAGVVVSHLEIRIDLISEERVLLRSKDSRNFVNCCMSKISRQIYLASVKIVMMIALLNSLRRNAMSLKKMVIGSWVA